LRSVIFSKVLQIIIIIKDPCDRWCDEIRTNELQSLVFQRIWPCLRFRLIKEFNLLSADVVHARHMMPTSLVAAVTSHTRKSLKMAYRQKSRWNIRI